MPKDVPIRVHSPPQAKRRRESTTQNFASNPPSQKERTQQFFIRNILYAFGDVKSPLEATVSATAKTLYEQMHLVYRLAFENRQRRNGSLVEVVDVLFVYRKDAALLHRIYRRLNARHQARKLQQAVNDKPNAGDEDKLIQELRAAFDLIGNEKLIDALDDNYVDSLRQERLARMDVRTRGMDQEEYLDFHQARGISFASSNSSRKVFFEWLTKNTSWQISASAGELLALLAYEVVAKLTEVAVAIKSVETTINEEEFQTASVGRQYNPDFVCNNPLFVSKFQDDTTRESSQLNTSEALEPKHIYEAIRRLQSARQPILYGGETNDYFRLI